MTNNTRTKPHTPESNSGGATPKQLRVAAKNFLSAKGVKMPPNATPETFVLRLGKRVSTKKLVRTSRATYWNALARVYAIYLRVKAYSNASDVFAAYANQLGVKMAPERDGLALLLRSYIEYGTLPSSRNEWAQDSRALRELEARGILPEDVSRLAERPGYGLRDLANAFSKRGGRQHGTQSSDGESSRTSLVRIPCLEEVAAGPGGGVLILARRKRGKSGIFYEVVDGVRIGRFNDINKLDLWRRVRRLSEQRYRALLSRKAPKNGGS